MSMQSALNVLDTAATSSSPDLKAPNSAEKASISPSTTPTAGVSTLEAPKTLEQALKPVSKPKSQIGADRFAALAKKERAIQKQLADLKAQQSKLSSLEQARKEAASNPIKALESLGLSYEQVTNFLLGGQKPTPELEVKAVKDEIAALKQEQTAKEQQQKEAARKQAEREYEEIISDFNSEIRGFVADNKATYELTSMYQGEDVVYATIEQYFANTGKIMSIREASDLVEQFFEDQLKAGQKAKKFQATQKPEAKGQSKGETVAKPSSPTLSNEMTSSAPSLLPAKTEQDRLNRAMAALSK